MNDSSRARSIAGWTIGWAIAATAAWLAPVTRLFDASVETMAILAIGGGAIGIGVGAYLAASARAESTSESRSAKAEAIVWAMAFAAAALFVTATPNEEFAKPGEVNAVTWPPPGQSRSSSGGGIQFSPVQIACFEAVPAFGAVGGLFAAVAGARRISVIGLLRAVVASAQWTVAVVVAAVIAVQSGYLLIGGLPRALGPWSPYVGLVVGAALSGALAGSIAGVIGEPRRQPADVPPDAAPLQRLHRSEIDVERA